MQAYICFPHIYTPQYIITHYKACNMTIIWVNEDQPISTSVCQPGYWSDINLISTRLRNYWYNLWFIHGEPVIEELWVLNKMVEVLLSVSCRHTLYRSWNFFWRLIQCPFKRILLRGAASPAMVKIERLSLEEIEWSFCDGKHCLMAQQ